MLIWIGLLFTSMPHCHCILMLVVPRVDALNDCHKSKFINEFLISFSKLCYRPQRSAWNQLGLEIRDSLVQYSLDKLTAEDKERKNLHFMTNNFAVTVDALLSTLPQYCTRLISFQVRN